MLAAKAMEAETSSPVFTCRKGKDFAESGSPDGVASMGSVIQRRPGNRVLGIGGYRQLQTAIAFVANDHRGCPVV